MLPVARDVIFVRRKERWISGKLVLGADDIRFVIGARFVVWAGREGTENTGSNGGTDVIAWHCSGPWPETNVKGSMGHGASYDELLV